MGSLRALLLASAAVAGTSFGTSGIAYAADMLPAAPPIKAPVAAPVEDFSGWYLRGDVGVGLDRDIKLRSTPDPLTQGAAGFVPTAYSISKARTSGSTFLSLGAGYQFNSWFRTDLTAEYRYASFQANDELLWNNGAGSMNVLRNYYRGNISTFTAMLNGYVDLGTWHGITPFVGAGVGVANQRLHGITDNGYNNLYAGPGAPGTSPTSGVYRASSKTSFAWALMAGLAYNVNSRLKLEMAYRYMNFGKVKSAVPTCAAFGPGPQACTSSLQFARSGSHDFKIGMRWMLSEPAPAPAPVEAPLVRKY